MLVASLDYDTHRGRIAIGRVHRGTIRAGDTLVHISADGDRDARSGSPIWPTFEGLERAPRSKRRAPATSSLLAGFADAKIGATLADPSAPEALPTIDDRGADAAS